MDRDRRGSTRAIWLAGIAVAIAGAIWAVMLRSSSDPGPPVRVARPVVSATDEAENGVTDDAPRWCHRVLPFTSTDFLEVRLGNGGLWEVPLRKQSPPALVHYAPWKAPRHINLVVGEPVWPPHDADPLNVLDTGGVIHRIHEGIAVTFSARGCDYQLIAYGFGESRVRGFVDGLAFPERRSLASADAFAMWPDSTPEDAYRTCLREQRPRAGDADMKTVVRFADEVLGWPDIGIKEIKKWSGDRHRYLSIEQNHNPSGPRLDISIKEKARGCWFVTSVQAPIPPRAPTSFSVSKVGGRLRVGFSLELRGYDEAVTIRLLTEGKEVSVSAHRFRDAGIETRGLPLGPTFFLVLIEDAAGQVIGAEGMSLGSGDLVAG